MEQKTLIWSSLQLSQNVTDRNFLSFQVQENFWGEQGEREIEREKDGMRLHSPFTKQVRSAQCCKVFRHLSSGVSALCYCMQKAALLVLTTSLTATQHQDHMKQS